jgi:hypothetical protein
MRTRREDDMEDNMEDDEDTVGKDEDMLSADDMSETFGRRRTSGRID